jgi:hypothetical protein
MTRKLPADPKPRTYFDQIPVEVVKRIAPVDEAPGKGPAQTDPAAVKPTPRRTGADTDSGHFHGVQFYNDPASLCRIVGNFIGEGVEQDALAVIIATPEHTARIESCLRNRGLDVEALKGDGRLSTFDARATLELFMTDGLPNPGSFRHSIGQMLTNARRGREHCTIRAYGEMVDLLWKDGREAAAIRLETLWNQLGSTHEFALLCGYSMGNFYKGAAIDEINSRHSHAVNEDGDTAALPAVM